MSKLMDDIVFVGDWVKERTLGSGSFGIVVLWRHRHSNERLAIKTCRWDTELTAKHRERWTKEVDMLKTCNNENIVGTKELPPEFVPGLEPANPSRLPILCMEYCSGGDLRQLLNRVESCSGLKELQVRSILRDVKNAMEFLYKNKITHRDLKPENIVMKVTGPDDDPSKCNVTYKLIDLGYAKEIDSNSVCASFVGTLEYLAPELFYSKTYSNSVDFWSFGLLAFEIICGVRPFLPHMSLVQWMPLVKKKSPDTVCVYETYHGDIEYSDQVFPENHITTPFKKHIEKWLRVALEYDPKLRGRDTNGKGVKFNLPAENGTQDADNKLGNVVLFSMLQDVLSKKILKIFSAYSLEILAYEIDETLCISMIQKWIERDINIPIGNQLLLSQNTYAQVENTELAVKYWNELCTVTLYLYHKDEFMKGNIQPTVPKAIQRCLEQPKALYNFKNSRELYKCGVYFALSEKNLYDTLITSCLVKAENLKVVGKKLYLKHNEVDKAIGRLQTMTEILSKTLTKCKKCVEYLNENTSVCREYLETFNQIFSTADEAIEKFAVLETAWNTVTTRLQSATRRSNEVTPNDLLLNFVSKLNFQSLLSEMGKCYVNYKLKEKELKGVERPCQDIVKCSYNILKIRDKILQEIRNQPFVLRLLDISLEFTKIACTIDTASINTSKLLTEISNIIDEIISNCWDTIKKLAPAHNETTDLPYSVVSFEKRNFKIGAPVTNHNNHIPKIDNHVSSMANKDLKSLIDDSVKLHVLQNQLTEKLNLHKKEISEEEYDFSFLDE